MALSRCGMVLAAGMLLSGPAAALSQTSTQPQTYEQMQAAQKQAKGASDPTAAPESATAPAAAPAVGNGTAPAAKPPLLDKHGKPVKEKVKKEKPAKPVPLDIVRGELTVDGLIAKAGLNFQIADLQYLYIWVPGLGTTVIATHPFPGSKIQPNALDGPTLTVKVDDHQLQVTSDGDMLDRKTSMKLLPGKKKPVLPTSLYVALDTSYQKDSIYPEFGYGDQNKAPYAWPGTLIDLRANSKTKAPPLPDNLRQKEQVIKLCSKNADGSQGACRDVEVPMATGKKS